MSLKKNVVLFSKTWELVVILLDGIIEYIFVPDTEINVT
jgi:hypothetical protein